MALEDIAGGYHSGQLGPFLIPKRLPKGLTARAWSLLMPYCCPGEVGWGKGTNGWMQSSDSTYPWALKRETIFLPALPGPRTELGAEEKLLVSAWKSFLSSKINHLTRRFLLCLCVLSADFNPCGEVLAKPRS